MVYLLSPEELRQLRQDAGLTLRAFGAVLGVAECTVCNWELGRQRPKYDSLVKINELAAKASNRDGK